MLQKRNIIDSFTPFQTGVVFRVCWYQSVGDQLDSVCFEFSLRPRQEPIRRLPMYRGLRPFGPHTYPEFTGTPPRERRECTMKGLCINNNSCTG